MARSPDDVSQEAYRKILRALSSRGTSLGKWAERNGFVRVTVYQVVRKWAPRTDRAPHGGISRDILVALRAELGPGIVPDPAAREAA